MSCDRSGRDGRPFEAFSIRHDALDGRHLSMRQAELRFQDAQQPKRPGGLGIKFVESERPMFSIQVAAKTNTHYVALRKNLVYSKIQIYLNNFSMFCMQISNVIFLA
jgi:hypothetical protein